MAFYSGFSHKKMWFSIVMLNYQRVYQDLYPSPLLHEFFVLRTWRDHRHGDPIRMPHLHPQLLELNHNEALGKARENPWENPWENL